MELVRYRSPIFDSARWEGFAFRRDDIVISTPPKSGTTWMQTLCAMVVRGTDHLDRPLSEISPWLDMQTASVDDVFARLEAQRDRRIIKTHTPLDGVPEHPGVTYVCVGRDPRDVALSFQHHRSNLDMDTFLRVRAETVGMGDLDELVPTPVVPDDPVQRFRAWIDTDGPFPGPTLTDVARHLATFWQRRHRPDVALFHYADLLADLEGQVRRLSAALGVELDDEQVDRISRAATFDRMKARAEEFVPEAGIALWRSNRDFFHRGSSGQWRDVIDAETLTRYDRAMAALLPADALAWAHGGWLAITPGAPSPGGRGSAS